MVLIEREIQNNVSSYLQEQYESEIAPDAVIINETKEEFEGDLTVICFPLAQHSKKSPEQTAKSLGEHLQDSHPHIEKYNVIQGFLNLVIADDYWQSVFNKATQDPDYWRFEPKDQTVLVEFSAPNTNKPQHLGHIRNNLLGYSIAQILDAYGYKTIKANLYNDRGVQIFQSMLAWQKWGAGITPKEAGVKGDQLIGDFYVKYAKALKKEVKELIADDLSEEQAQREAPLKKEVQNLVKRWEKGDEEVVALWEKLNSWVYDGFAETYNKLGITFDKQYYESQTYTVGKSIVEEGLKKEVFYRAQNGSVWVDLSEFDLDKKLLLREDGTSVYITQDLGTAQVRYDEYKMDQSIYVVGSEQNYHFKVLRSILKKLAKPYADGIYHLSYGMINLPSGKMKSREGTVVDADDLIQEMIDTAREHSKELGRISELKKEQVAKLYETIGLGALKFHLLKVEPKKDILFDPEETIDFQGHTGPFVQYTYARIQSVIRKFKSQFPELDVAYESGQYETLRPLERAIIIELSKFPKMIEEAAQNYAPSSIANYGYELAKLYNKFYAEVPILNAEKDTETAFRIKLSKVTARTIQDAMELLGIHVPERM